jgi:hypothetical protein
VNFDSKFASKPSVVTFLGSQDVSVEHDHRLKIIETGATEKGFNLVAGTWSDTVIYGAGAAWVAFKEGQRKPVKLPPAPAPNPAPAKAKGKAAGKKKAPADEKDEDDDDKKHKLADPDPAPAAKKQKVSAPLTLGGTGRRRGGRVHHLHGRQDQHRHHSVRSHVCLQWMYEINRWKVSTVPLQGCPSHPNLQGLGVNSEFCNLPSIHACRSKYKGKKQMSPVWDLVM